MLSFSHPAGTIHLRLKGADDILAKAAAEEERNNILYTDEGDMTTSVAAKDSESGTTDMLVKRLNDSITRALETVQILAQRGSTCLIDEETDAAAKEIDLAEQTSRQEWITNHSRPDEDGRARCSFHFCQKLFKDIAFLHKHLQKKHVDQLRAELAKCHDGPMMMAWDAWDRNTPRPVPPVLIDCGSKYGLISSMVTESDSLPTSIDPEPDLWREDQRRIEEEEEWQNREREATRAEVEQHMQRRREHEQSNSINGGEKRKSNFADPDDMIEEKVELSFENIVVAPPPKKKKKKKSLL